MERCLFGLHSNNQTDQGLERGGERERGRDGGRGRERERDQRGGIREEGTGKGWFDGFCFSQVSPAVALLDQEKL